MISAGGNVVINHMPNSFAFRIYKERLQFPTQWSKGLGGFPEGFPGGFHGFPGVSEQRQGESALSETLRFTVKGLKREGCPSAREYPYYNNIHTDHGESI